MEPLNLRVQLGVHTTSTSRQIYLKIIGTKDRWNLVSCLGSWCHAMSFGTKSRDLSSSTSKPDVFEVVQASNATATLTNIS